MGRDDCHLQPGDPIEIGRTLYRHWVLYMGDGEVTHMSPIGEGTPCISGSSASLNTTRAKVKRERLEEVVGKNTWCVNKKYDSSRTPLPVEEIIRRAEHWIDREVPYDVLGNNCEHFVTMLRYGEPLSEQVTDAFVICAAAAAGVLVGLVLLFAFSGMSSSSSTSRRERKYC